jgi:hypothetical protein
MPSSKKRRPAPEREQELQVLEQQQEQPPGQQVQQQQGQQQHQEQEQPHVSDAVAGYLQQQQSIASMRVAPGTTTRYQDKLKNMEKWMASNGFSSLLDMSCPESSRIRCPHDTPQKLEGIKAFFGWVGRDRGINGASSFCTHSTYGGYQSALAWLYRKKRIEMPIELRMELQDLSRGWKNKFTTGQRGGEITTKTGKTYNRFDGYIYLAESFIKLFQPSGGAHGTGGWSALLTSWLFHLLTWNMFQRANTVANIFLEHVSWIGDHLNIHVPGHKGDTSGEVEEAKDKSVYANAINPSICCVLAFAVLIYSKLEYFCRGWIAMAQRERERDDREGADDIPSAGMKRGSRKVKQFVPISPKVFEGTGIEKAHSDHLHVVLNRSDKAGKARLGIEDENEIDTHSNRKGGASHVLSLCDGPDGTNVFMRAGWKFGSTQQAYLFQGGGGDQKCGRAASGLPIESKEFCTLPPHFTQPVAESEMRDVVEGWDDISAGMQLLLTMLAASIVFHDEWLRANFPSEGANAFPLFGTPLYASGFVARHRGSVKTGLWRDGPLVVSGVEKIHKIEQQINQLEEHTASRFKGLEEKIELLPNLTADAVCRKATVNGVSDYVTRDDLFQVVTRAIQSSSMFAQVQGVASEDGMAVQGDDDVSWVSYDWSDGSEHMVPEGYRFPADVSPSQLWHVWHYGKVISEVDGRTQCMRPLSMLSGKDMVAAGDKINLSRARQVIAKISAHIQADDTGITNGLIKFLEEINYSHPRVHDVTYNTIYKHYLLSKRGAQ